MLIADIERLLPSLRESERKVARYVLEKPNVAARSAIKAIAEGARVSEPTVIRFCRAVGCRGVQDLKQRLARDLGRASAPVLRPRGDPNAASGALDGALDRALAVILDLRVRIDPPVAEAAAAALAEARLVILLATAADALLARQAARAFPRALALEAGEAGVTEALDRGDAVIAVGSGSPAMALALCEARRRRAVTIAVGPDGAPCLAVVEFALCVSPALTDPNWSARSMRLAAALALEALADAAGGVARPA